MEPIGSVKVRRSITDLQNEYEKGNTKPLEDLMRAWKGIKAHHPTNPQSFFMLAGYHGEPFRGAGWGVGGNAWWGGYCNHGNVLFPVWHRAYLLKLEEALQAIPNCEDVTLPFWDETSAESREHGIPWALTREKITIDGVEEDNPLRSFVFNKGIVDNISGDNPNYSKPKGYETVRYPLSGLVGSSEEQEATKTHNSQYTNYDENVRLLNKNIKEWLTTNVVIDGQTVSNNVTDLYRDCLKAPNYTVFSNTTSAQQWNEDQGDASATDPSTWVVVPLEEPHNSIHLAVGGFEIPSFDADLIDGANGDMGENDTASFDPIFYFHHCHVDRMFWLWQEKHGCTEYFDIIPHYPGTNSVDNQGPTPGVAANSWLTMDSPLDPFTKSDGTTYTARDCIDIRRMGYTYGDGSHPDTLPKPDALQAGQSSKRIHISGINRASVRGSFLISAHAIVDGKKFHIGTKSVLSRWHVQGCTNCMTHQEAKATFPLHGLSEETLEKAIFSVDVHTRDGKLSQRRGLSLLGPKPFRFEVR